MWVHHRVVVYPAMVAEPDGSIVRLVHPKEDIDGLCRVGGGGGGGGGGMINNLTPPPPPQPHPHKGAIVCLEQHTTTNAA